MNAARQNSEAAMLLIEAVLALIEHHSRRGTLSREIMDSAADSLLDAADILSCSQLSAEGENG